MTSVPKAYFERLYAEHHDPWEFESSWYEQRKYQLTMACLPEPRYASAFEPGCSIGVFTEMLAERCDRVLAADFMAAPVARAAARFRGLHHVTVERLTLPDEWPDGPFDLVVLSEVAYYFDPDTLIEVMETAIGSAAPGANLVAVHWRGPTDYPLSGDEAHELMRAAPGLHQLARHWEEAFVLDVWRLAE